MARTKHKTAIAGKGSPAKPMLQPATSFMQALDQRIIDLLNKLEQEIIN